MTPVEPDPNAGLNGAVAGELRAMKSRRQSSNEQIAERSSIPLVSVNRYMAGKRPINLAVLAELAAALDSDASVIVRAALGELQREPTRRDTPDATIHDFPGVSGKPGETSEAATRTEHQEAADAFRASRDEIQREQEELTEEP